MYQNGNGTCIKEALSWNHHVDGSRKFRFNRKTIEPTSDFAIAGC